MTARRVWGTWCGVLCTAAAAAAVDVTVTGQIYGAATYDRAEGSVAGAAGTSAADAAGAIIQDGDPAYTFRYEADVGIRAAFSDRVAANLDFTLDDRKKPRYYRYDLLRETSGTYRLVGTEETTSWVYASLEEVNVELDSLVAATDVTLGGFDVRYANGGYYNALVNRLDAACFGAYFDPFGVELGRRFGPLGATLAAGAALDHQPVVAMSEQLGGFGFYAAAEGRTYDLKSLWDTHYASSLPGYWRYYFEQTGDLAAEPTATPAAVGKTFHVALDKTWDYPQVKIYAAASFHRFADAPELAADPTGGFFCQFYADPGAQIIWPRLWLRAATLYEFWKANYENTFADGLADDDSLLLFAEPEYFIRDDLYFGFGGRYLNPSRRTPNSTITPIREDIPVSIGLLPHLRYLPAPGVILDLTYGYTRWDYSFDNPETGTREDLERELRLEIEAAF